MKYLKLQDCKVCFLNFEIVQTNGHQVPVDKSIANAYTFVEPAG